MSQQTYEIRNYRSSDFDGYVKLQLEAEKVDQSGRCTSRQVLQEYLHRPLYDPQKDLFIAEASGKIAGFLNIKSELITHRVLLDFLVHPEHRRKGLAKQLLDRAMPHIRGLKVDVMHASVLEENAVARKVLSKLGFNVIRHFLEMSLSLSDIELPDVRSNDFTMRHLQRGEEEKLAQLQNRCFADTWGFNPNTPEEIAYSLSLSDASPEDVVLIYDGERPAGYCWTKTNCERAAGKGRILMLGVDLDYRGRGIGRLALLEGLSHLKDKGIGAVDLTVDSENLAAHSLYRSSGFQVRTRSLYYEKRID
ncbi:MAG TPA: GNAT family N-acetyltransferase [Dehalococcoidia bacterium]|nr:GNAT family N-acetyltransferase [Dehalococcoidia bacterium]